MFIGWPELSLIILLIILPIALMIKFPAFRKAVGISMAIIGLLLCLSIPVFGLFIGIPLLFIGAIAFFAGEGRKEITVITPPTQAQVQAPLPGQKIMVRCPSCKSLNDEAASYCSSCGYKLR